MFAYECIVNSLGDSARSEARRLLNSGWVCGRYPALRLDSELPWALQSHQERSWNFHLHSWDMFDGLLQAYSQDGELDWLRPCVRIALDWTSRHVPAGEDNSPFAWYDMAVGLRAYRLAYLFEAAQAAGLLDAGQSEVLWQALLAHAAYLADDANIAFHNNHGYYQVAGQLAMGRRFYEDSAAMEAALLLGRERLQRMLVQQFTSEGIHREHSPDYHRMVYETLRGLIDAGLVEDASTLELASRIEESLSWFIQPNRRIANFGDSDYRWMGSVSAEARQRWRTPLMQYAASGGACGEAPSDSVAAFAEGGYFVLRQLAADGDFRQASYLAQTAAFHSRTHKHADDLSFIWMERGSELLVDAGRYGYLGKTEKESPLWLDGHWYSDPLRVYCESTRAHNTLEFDGRNYPRRRAPCYGSALRRWCRQDGLVAVETETRHFSSIRRTRLLILKPGHWLMVIDWYDDTQGQPHDVRQWFHLAPQLQLEESGAGFLARVPGSHEPLRIIDLLDGSTPSRPYLGQMELAGEPAQGWWSPAERDAVPAWAFHFRREQQTRSCFATLLSFSSYLRPELQQSEVNETGRRGTLIWRDEWGMNKLVFYRPLHGDLRVALC